MHLGDGLDSVVESVAVLTAVAEDLAIPHREGGPGRGRVRRADRSRGVFRVDCRLGEAMGILMARHHVTEDQAFDVLRRYSQERNIKLLEVARLVCDTGSLGQP